MDVEQLTGELYGLRPSEFTAARDAYVAEARRAKDTAAAKAIAALRRPPLAVWAANLLARERPQEAERFLALGEALREAHQSLDGERLREAVGQRHQLVAALARTTAGLAEEAGQPLSDPVQREVEQILHAVLAHPDAAGPWSAGRLATAPEAAVDFTAVTPPAPPKPPAGRRPKELARARAAAQEARTTATRHERQHDTARKAHQTAKAAAEKAADRLRRAEHDLEEARRAAAAAEHAASEADTGLRSAERAMGEAREAAEQAEAEVRRHERDD
ncbi:hypothetical protein [Streptomyces sp. NPDC058495]|uniref:hypothetical protein n=1 Tax=unclassified Streptomyces TaxID=2593676 RepID=UPI00364A1F2B